MTQTSDIFLVPSFGVLRIPGSLTWVVSYDVPLVHQASPIFRGSLPHCSGILIPPLFRHGHPRDHLSILILPQCSLRYSPLPWSTSRQCKEGSPEHCSTELVFECSVASAVSENFHAFVHLNHDALIRLLTVWRIPFPRRYRASSTYPTTSIGLLPIRS